MAISLSNVLTRSRGLRDAVIAIAMFSALIVGLDVNVAIADVSKGTWTKLVHPCPVSSSSAMYLLTDGTVMVVAADNNIGDGRNWYRLMPDTSGNYSNSIWSIAASMTIPRVNFAGQVLPNGKLLVLGGNTSSGMNSLKTGQIYDPVANSWTDIATYPGNSVMESSMAILQSGQLLVGDSITTDTYLFDPSKNVWTKTKGLKVHGSNSAHQQWVMLPNGDVLTCDLGSSTSGYSERYVAATGNWTDSGVVPVWLQQATVTGPPTLQANGNVFWPGDKVTALYNVSNTSWSTGPALPATIKDIAGISPPVCGAMVPDGHYFMVTSNPKGMIDYDSAAGTMTDISSTLPADLQTRLKASPAPINLRMLVLPNGHVLFNPGGKTIWEYTSSGTPLAAAQPATDGSQEGSFPNYRTYGTLLTGLWQGSSVQGGTVSTNYPIISLKGPGTSTNVYYARTTDWTPGVAISKPYKPVDFTLPAGITVGTYQLSVIANGIASKPAKFNVTSTTPSNNYVTAVFTSATATAPNKLTLTGDAGANSVTITQNSTGLVIQGNNLTKIGTPTNNATQVSFNMTGDVVIKCSFFQSALPPTADSITLSAVNSSSTTIDFSTGEGGNIATLSYCVIGTLTVDGGIHTLGVPNILSTVTSKITKQYVTDVP